ncbi:unnamed protein product [Knipowitschia caucasica]
MYLVASAFGTVRQMYRGLNPATLSGAIDVIVVQQPDGTFQSSPFHVRFGKLGVLRSSEIVVDIELNGEPVDLHMKLGDNGEAFFGEENEELEVSAHLCTSPIPRGSEESPESPEGITTSAVRRKKRRKKRVSALRDESSSEENQECEENQEKEERPLQETQLQTSKSIYYSLCEETEQLEESHAHSDSEQSPSETALVCRPSSPKSDSELCVRPRTSGPEILWNWGGFPTPCQSQSPPVHSSSSHFHTIKRQESFDLGLQTPAPKVVRPKARTRSLDFNNCSLHPPEATEQTRPNMCSLGSGFDRFHREKKDSMFSDHIQNGKLENGGLKEEEEGFRAEELMQRLKEEVSSETCAVNGEEELNSDGEEATLKSESQKKESRNHNMGSSDIYLDNLSSLDPEEVDLYLAKTDKESSQPAGALSQSGSFSPQSEGSDYLSDSMSFSPEVSLSLCGPGDSSISKEKFLERVVTFQDLSENPSLIDDPNLVVCINSNYYNWAVAAPMILSLSAFQKNLPKSTVEQLVKDKMSKKSGRWWFPFRRRDIRDSQKSSKDDADEPLSSLPLTVHATLDDVDSDEAAGLGRSASLPPPSSPSAPQPSLPSSPSAPLSTSHSFSRKSLRLTSRQIEQLHLLEGENSMVFSVTTQYQGTCRCEASVFLWSWNDRVVISDIDGTITKSDALGHLLTSIGADWTHSGIATLYHRIHQNGYRLLYCSARAIGMSASTKKYLRRVNDCGAPLPKGPVLLAPSSLMSALHREVIEKKPEEFKVACLGDIRDLFNPHRDPFYAAFGNRTNDAFAYSAVGVPDTRIFTVNPRGELVQEKTRSNKSSYPRLCEQVEHFFPPICGGVDVLQCPDFSSATYWKQPLPAFDLDVLL